MYRDEREILRDEVQQLRREVESARADQARLVAVEAELEDARRKLTKLETERILREGPRPRGRSGNVVLVASVLALLVLGVVGFLFGRAGTSVHAPGRPVVETAVETAVEPKVAMPAPTETAVEVAKPMPPAPPAITVHTRWIAKVVKARGIALAAGSTCSIAADVVSDDDGALVRDVMVTCGALTLYDQRGRLEGMSSTRSSAEQHPGEKAGTWTYDLTFSDTGTRGPTRNQATLDSTKRLGKIWSENLPELRVDLAIDPHSAPTEVAIHHE